MAFSQIILGAFGALGATYLGWLVSRVDKTRAAQINAIIEISNHVQALTITLTRWSGIAAGLKSDRFERDFVDFMKPFHMRDMQELPDNITRLSSDRLLVGFAWGDRGDALSKALIRYSNACRLSIGQDKPHEDLAPAHNSVFAEIEALERFKRRWWRRLLP